VCTPRVSARAEHLGRVHIFELSPGIKVAARPFPFPSRFDGGRNKHSDGFAASGRRVCWFAVQSGRAANSVIVAFAALPQKIASYGGISDKRRTGEALDSTALGLGD
jgi:hypothetical protein